MSSSGEIYLADTVNDTIRKISALGVVNTLGGVPLMAGSADGTGVNARFASPQGLALDSADNLFIGDTGNNTIRKGVRHCITFTDSVAIPDGLAITKSFAGAGPVSTAQYFKIVYVLKPAKT